MKSLASFTITALFFCGAPVSIEAQTKITDTTPYYMCFAYTPDGVLFAGGDFAFARAKKMVFDNCGMPQSIKVVLLKTVIAHSSKETVFYKAR